jgi:hypothetical protein
MEEKSQLLVIVFLSNLVFSLIRVMSTSPECLVIVGEQIFLAILSGRPPLPLRGFLSHSLAEHKKIWFGRIKQTIKLPVVSFHDAVRPLVSSMIERRKEY